jgi:hypothetical protein
MSSACIAFPRLEASSLEASSPASFRTVLQIVRAAAGASTPDPTQPIDDTARKGPQTLRLLQPTLQPELSTENHRVVRSIPQPELAFYRKYTEAMLLRYMKLSFEAGRVPSLLGRELFKGDVSHCTMHAFDDVVIFVRDVGAMIARLSPGLQHLIRRIALQGYSQGETAAMHGISLRSVTTHYAEAIDKITAMLLAAGMMEIQREAKREA